MIIECKLVREGCRVRSGYETERRRGDEGELGPVVGTEKVWALPTGHPLPEAAQFSGKPSQTRWPSSQRVKCEDEVTRPSP